MHKTVSFILFLFVGIYGARAQKIDHLASFRDIKGERYFRFNYDNDYFAATDENYTQGYSLEVVAPFLKVNPANKLFFKPTETENRYGLAVEHIGFTPNRFELPEIQEGDRPFAAAIVLRSFLIATNLESRQRFYSALSVGLIGPGAFGKEMQTAIHEATGNKIPLGWDNQVKNDLVVQYEVGVEKQMLRYTDIFSLQVNATARLGTLFTNASAGVNSTLGIINNAFTSAQKRNGFRLYTYAAPRLSFIGYDATLQGGLINQSSPYTIAASEVERLTAQMDYGVVLKTKTLYFEYTRSVITREFTTGDSYKWGGVRVGFTW